MDQNTMINKNSRKRQALSKNVRDYIMVVIGSFLLAFAISSILKPNGLMTGGITGISLIIEHVFHISYTVAYYILSLTVLTLTYLTLGKREAGKIVIFSIVFPLVLILFDYLSLDIIQDDLFLASIFFGVLAGAATGIILKAGFSSGGTDTLAKIINKKLFRFMSISVIIAALDSSIILVSAFAFDTRIALYAIVTQVVAMKAVDTVLFGFSSKVIKLEIISEKEAEIESYILHDLRRGISKYNIVGGYTKAEKIKLVTLVSPRESILIRDFIAKTDEKAFVSVIPVNSVWGEGIGFDRLNNEDFN